MSSTPIFIRGVLGSWRGLLAWAAAIVAVLLLYLPLYPSMQTPELSQMINNLPSELVQALGYEDITSGAGYTQATFFGLIGFILIIIAAISWGSAAIAGNEESGQLELTLAHAVGRVQYALESAAAWWLRSCCWGWSPFSASPFSMARLSWAYRPITCSRSFWRGRASG